MMKLPIGISDFKKIIDNQYDFVDKSLLTQEIERDAEVILITRPRRFGKTLNMSMLQYFFAAEVRGQSTKGLFDNLKIAQESAFYLKHQGKYPVISLSFKDLKAKTFEQTYVGLCELISELYAQYLFLLDGTVLHDHEKIIYEAILKQKASDVNINSSLKKLIEYLYRYHGVNPLVLLDEYDSPIQAGYLNNYYDDIVDFFRTFLSSALKDNPYLFKAVLTGILRVSKESLFSGLNNIIVYSVLHPKYGPYFGFTEAEVIPLLEKAGLQNKTQEIKEWYNGYEIGDSVVYNPWSTINCIKEKGILKPYWVNTSDNALIQSLFAKSSTVFKDQFEALLSGDSIEKFIDESFVYADLHKQGDLAIYNLLLMTGYLKSISVQESEQGTSCQLAIPNKEIRSLYRKIIEQWLSREYGVEWHDQFIHHLLEGNITAFEQDLTKIMEQTVSVHDMASEPEAFYHGLMIGLTASLHGHENYELRSNRESGYGRYDYLILSRDVNKFSIILELKKVKLPEGKNAQKALLLMLQSEAQVALQQIEKQAYISEIKQRDLHKILKIGVAFCGKRFALAYT